MNGDQVSHLACEEYIDYLKSNGIQLNIDGKGRALHNIFIKGFWRTIKYQYIYLNPSASEVDLFIGIKK